MIARAGHNMRTLILAILLLRIARAPPALSRERCKTAARGRTGDGRAKSADKFARANASVLGGRG
eukprot:scaffold17342_cov130-Isochrysis_galbana.AAC.8